MSAKQTDLEITDIYSGTVRVEFRPQGHKYSVVVDGVRTKPPSVTGITGVLNKPALVGWAVSCTLDVVARCIQPDTAYSVQELNTIFSAARRQAQNIKEEAAGIGTAAHDWIHEHLSGRNPEMPPPGSPYRPCVDAVLDFFLTHDVQWIHTERPIYSKLYGYSGRMDGDAKVDGRLTLVDFKTGGVYVESRLQSAAYVQARHEEGYDPYDQRLILRLGKLDGKFEKAFYSSEDQEADFKAFLGLREAFVRMDALEMGCELCGSRETDRRTRCKECQKLVCKKCIKNKLCTGCQDPLEGE